MNSTTYYSPPALSCDSNGNPDGALNFRIGGLFGVLAASLLGFLLPTFFSNRPSLDFVYYLFQAFSAGVVIATGLVHVLPDAVIASQNPCLGLSQELPWVAIATLHAVLLTFIGEHCLQRWMAHAWRKKQAEAAAAAALDENGLEKGPLTEEEEREHLELQNLRVIAYTLEAGVIFHSVFVGLTLGTSHDTSFVKGLTFALLFHQGFEGIALGAAVSRAQVGWVKTLLFGLAFALTTPIGVALGIGIGNSYNANSKQALGLEVAFNSLSAGILIYNGIVDIILPTFEVRGGQTPRSPLRTAIGFVMMFCGSGLMSFVAKWA